jgi:hypothetical protein
VARSNSSSWLKKFKGSSKSASNVRAAIRDLIVEIGNERVRSPHDDANAPVVTRIQLLRRALLTRAFVEGDPEAIKLVREYLLGKAGEGGSGVGSPAGDADYLDELEQEYIRIGSLNEKRVRG